MQIDEKNQKILFFSEISANNTGLRLSGEEVMKISKEFASGRESKSPLYEKLAVLSACHEFTIFWFGPVKGERKMR
jgi:hypothetical protein